MKLDFKQVEDAAKRLDEHVVRTPVMTSPALNEMLNCEIFFKCENFQKIGAFKFRGATNAVLALSDEQIHNGVATHSSGNHGQALARAARLRSVPAYVVMPRTASLAKIAAVTSYGGTITFCEPTVEARQSTLHKIVAETGAAFIHPSTDPFVIAGQGTAALEFVEQIRNLDLLVTPVGGGGLLSGTGIVAKHLGGVEVWGAEPKAADDAYRSFRDKILYPSLNAHSIADGLLSGLDDLTFELVCKNVDKILTAEEDSIKKALRFIWERMKIIVEPSSAVALATLFENPDKVSGRRIGIILTGGNVDFNLVLKYWSEE